MASQEETVYLSIWKEYPEKFREKLLASWEYELEEQRHLKEIEKLKEENKKLKEEVEWNKISIQKEVRRHVDIEEKLKEENEELKEENFILKDRNKELDSECKLFQEEIEKLKDKADHWEDEHSTLWLSVFGALDDGGYGATSTGQVVSFIRDIIKENEEQKEKLTKLKTLIFGGLLTQEQTDEIFGQAVADPDEQLWDEEDYIKRVRAFLKQRDTFKKKSNDCDYWKNFALVYWSGGNLGDDDNVSGSELWTQCLEKFHDDNDTTSHEELTELCMNEEWF